MSNDKIRYFLPNQAVLHLEHPKGLETEQLLGILNSYLEGNAPWNDRLKPTEAESVIIFNGEEAAFSIVPTPFSAPDDNEDTAYGSTAEAILELYEAFSGSEEGIVIGEQNGAKIKLMSAAPNWLMGAGSHQIGIGGPGNWPEGASEADGRRYKFNLLEPQLIEIRLLESLKAKQGEGVHVAILDSAPCLHEMAEAYEYWHEHCPGKHPLLEDLLAPGGPLSVYPATFDDLRSIADYSAIGHRYPMTDHGLFIASIIHTIAPKATLHLYEVLSPYGMGSIETIAKGIFNVLSNPKIGRPLIINNSFMLGAGSGEDFDPDVSVFQPAPAGRFSGLTLTVRKLFETLTTTGTAEKIEKDDLIVVAAAGNDATPGATRPPARYPAAYDNVISVGALTKPLPTGNKEFASYSNHGNKGLEKGYLTLGGEKGGGIEGVYIGGLPVNRSGLPDKDPGIQPDDISVVPNADHGWAKWSGTSFAAPIISGLLAAWWSNDAGKTPTDARDDFLAGISTSPPAGVATRFTSNERIIAVDQVVV